MGQKVQSLEQNISSSLSNQKQILERIIELFTSSVLSHHITKERVRNLPQGSINEDSGEMEGHSLVVLIDPMLVWNNGYVGVGLDKFQKNIFLVKLLMQSNNWKCRQFTMRKLFSFAYVGEATNHIFIGSFRQFQSHSRTNQTLKLCLHIKIQESS